MRRLLKILSTLAVLSAFVSTAGFALPPAPSRAPQDEPQPAPKAAPQVAPRQQPRPKPHSTPPPRRPAAISTGVAVTVQVVSSQPPQQFSNSLRQNYPNPFSTWTVFRYSVARATRVSIVIYSITGQRVATLVDGWKSPGAFTVTWDGRGPDGKRVASGVYMYRAIADGFTQTRKLILTR